MIVRGKRKDTEDNGVWLATTEQHHEGLTPRVPEHAIHSCTREGSNGLAGHSGRRRGFRGGGARACDLVMAGEPRIGKVPGGGWQVAGTDGKREEIDDFTGLAPQNMSAQNAVRAFFHDERSLKFRVKREMTSTWYSSRRVRKHIQVTKCSVLNLSLLLPPPVALPGTTIQAPHLSGARVRKGVRIRRR